MTRRDGHLGTGDRDTALTLLAELVRTRSVNPPGDGEGEVAQRLRVHLDAAGLDTDVLVGPQGRPSLVARLEGPTDRPPLVLLSHTDVVPVAEDGWSRDPFGGEIVDGELWGRGTLDMKGVAVLHAEAVAALATGGATPDREVIVVAVADEEAGGTHGAAWLLDAHPDRVGFRDGSPAPEVLGEGGFGLSGVLDRPLMPIVVGEKAPLWLRARATGAAGHGSLPTEDQAIRGLTRFVEAVAGSGTARVHPVMREQFTRLAEVTTGAERRVFQLLASGAGPAAVRALAPALRARAGVIGHLLADTITPTQLEAGYKHNVVPGSAEASFDARLLPDTDVDALVARLRRVGRRHGVEVEVAQAWSGHVSDRGALFDDLAAASADLPGAPVPIPSLTPGTTDLRFFRSRGATAYGWVPLVLTPELLATFHGDDERVPVDGFGDALHAMSAVVHGAGAART